MKFVSLLFIVVIGCSQVPPSKPKIVVGIVVDQMRQDYLTRFSPYFGESGFKKLMKDGSYFTQANYNYVPTYTGPGHATIFTGTTPFHHGIVGNDWYDRALKSTINCVDDSTTTIVGGDKVKKGFSPVNLKGTGLADQFKISLHPESRAFGISFKNRGAILPVGHSAHSAYWYDYSLGRLVTSTYYHQELPTWVESFNQEVRPSNYPMIWELTLPRETYRIAFPDTAAWESDAFKEKKTWFPHSRAHLDEKTANDRFAYTPFSNDYLVDFAEKLIANEKPGKNGITDLLTISFSSTDIMGHSYGPNSVEVMDMYIRLDKTIARLLSVLDKEYGKGNYLLFLTSDHGVVENLDDLKRRGIPSHDIKYDDLLAFLKGVTKELFGTEQLIESFFNDQIYINRTELKNRKLNESDVLEILSMELPKRHLMIQSVLSRNDFQGLVAQRDSRNYFLNGFDMKRSGDLYLNFLPNSLVGYRGTGTTHGSPYVYDTHVPMIFYGWNVPSQERSDAVFITDITPTVCQLLGINKPAHAIGEPVIGKVKK